MATISPKQIYDRINQKVVGQEAAKRIVSTAMFLHWVRFCQTMREGVPLKKSNILLTGATGTGKTLLVREASQAIKDLTTYQEICPVLEVDCTELTGRGWEGESLTNLLRNFYRKQSGNDVGFASSVIFLDEFDKLCKPAVSSHGVDHNKLTQYNLLKAIEGIKIPGNSDAPEISTEKMLFIFAGNFSEIRDKRAAVNKQIGFNRDVPTSSQQDLHTELEATGVSTQLVGRIAQVGELKELTKKELGEVLERFLIPEYTTTWAFLNKTLKVKKSLKEDMIQRCFDRKTGARGLQADLARHVEGDLFDVEFDVG